MPVALLRELRQDVDWRDKTVVKTNTVSFIVTLGEIMRICLPTMKNARKKNIGSGIYFQT